MIFQQPKLVIIESPFKATPYYSVEQHRLYLMHAIEHCLRLGEAPFASHHLIPEILDDGDPVERAFGIKCGFAWGQHADLVAVYGDLGIGPGMADAIEHWNKLGKRIEWRKLPDKIVTSVKRFGEFTPLEPTPNENTFSSIDSPAVSFVPD
jgi:hypothetical protein